MAFGLKCTQPVASDLRRIVDRQLCLAIAELSVTGGERSDAVIHEARRHVKKARAAIRLLRESRGRAYGRANGRLRTVNHMLAPIADGEGVLETFGRLVRRHQLTLPRRTIAAIHVGLVENEIRAGRQATLNRTLETAAALLEAERRKIGRWPDAPPGFKAIRSGLRRSFRAAQRGRARLSARQSLAHIHSWRRRVKDHWLQVRLLERRCGNKLATDRRRLEALDEYLGEYHNCGILEEIVAGRRLVPPADAARWRRSLRRYRAELRRAALAAGREIYREKPGQFVRRIRGLWRKVRAAARRREARQPN